MFLKRLLKEIHKGSPRFKIGLLFIVISPFISWVFVPFFGVLAIEKNNPHFGLLALIIYATTWILTFIGLLLSGKRGIQFAFCFFKKGKDG